MTKEQENKETYAKGYGFSLILCLSHSSFVFPVKLLSKEENRVSLFFYENEVFSLKDWLELFKFTFSYKFQWENLNDKEEKFSFCLARLLDKVPSEDGGLYLEVELQESLPL